MYDHHHFPPNPPQHCSEQCWPAQNCSEQGCSGTGQDCTEPNTPVPPPIPPVRYVPGMNVQEQLCNMAERVNISINRWNQIQANCYKALDNVVGAAVNNDVYYSSDEVRFSEGYDEDSGCKYSLVEAKAVDRSGRPIVAALRAAYNNETNSGARENILDVSFVTSAVMTMTAVQATETRWNGTTVFGCNPGAGEPNTEGWVAGWNRNGVLRFFPGDVDQCVLRQNGMVNCIGPVFPVVKAGQLFTQVTESLGVAPGSIQAMGWKKFNGNKMFFSCGNYDQPGMSPISVAKLLQRMGCDCVVITSYQTSPVGAYVAMPIAGTEQVPGATVPGLTGGMTYLGKLTDAPIDWSIPQNCAAWVISKRPPSGWTNAFTSEIANVVQKIGGIETRMESTLGQIENENSGLDKMRADIAANQQDISELTYQVGGFDSRITETETALNRLTTDVTDVSNQVLEIGNKLDKEIQDRTTQGKQLQQAITNETYARESADGVLDAKIKAEESERKAQDAVLVNSISQEASERKAADASLKAEIDTVSTNSANSDRNLQNAIDAEIQARSTKDTQHEAQIEAIQAEHQKDITNINQQIANIMDGTGLPVASATVLGAIKVGKNLQIEEDGTLNAAAGGEGGKPVLAGSGINVAESIDGYTVSINNSVVVTEDELTPVKDKVTALETKQADQAAKDQQQDEKIKNAEVGIEALENENKTVADEVQKLTEAVEQNQTTIVQEITNIKNGEALPIAGTEQLGVIKVGANLSISEDGTLSASAGEGGSGETVAQGAGIEVTHDTATNVATVALNKASQDAIAAVAGKADSSTVEELTTAVAGKADRTTVDGLNTTVQGLSTTVSETAQKVTEVETTANAAASGVSQLNSAQTALGNRVTTAEQNIDAVTAEQTTIKDEQTKQANDMMSIDDTATEALKVASDAEKIASGKVDKTGDTMTGTLKIEAGEEPSIVLAGPADDKPVGIAGGFGNISVGIFKAGQEGPVTISGVNTPSQANDAVNKSYVDTTVANVTETANQANVAAQEAKETAGTAQTAATSALDKATDALEKADGAAMISSDGSTPTNTGSLILRRADALPHIKLKNANIGTAIRSASNGSLTVMKLNPDGSMTEAAEVNIAPGSSDAAAVTLKQLNDAINELDTSGFVKKSGDKMTGSLIVSSLAATISAQSTYGGYSTVNVVSNAGKSVELHTNDSPSLSAIPGLRAYGSEAAFYKQNNNWGVLYFGSTNFGTDNLIPVLVQTPTDPFHAATKGYIDTNFEMSINPQDAIFLGNYTNPQASQLFTKPTYATKGIVTYLFIGSNNTPTIDVLYVNTDRRITGKYCNVSLNGQMLTIQNDYALQGNLSLTFQPL